MKSRQKRILICQWLGILFLGLITSIQGSAQCGAESITASPWCENTYAHWQFNTPTPNASYTWYNWQGPYTPADVDVNGHIIKAGAVKYDSTTATDFYSPFRVQQATNPAGIQFAYVKRVEYKAVPYPAVAPAFTVTGPNSAFSMTYTNTAPVRFNSIKIPVVLNTPGKQYKIQIMIGATGSAVYTFSTLSATHLTGNNYIITVPVNLTTTGNQTISVNTNPAAGTGAQVDGLLYSTAQAPASTAGTVSVAANAASAGFSVMYDWDITVTCAPQSSGIAVKTTTGCCVIPTSVNFLTVSPDKSTIVNNGGVNVNFTIGSFASASNYFAWYLNGTLQAAASGVGKTTFSSNKTGTWEVREVASAADLSNPSCYANASTVIQDKKIFATTVTAPSHSPLCLGDQWSFSGTGSSNLTWSAGGGTLSAATGSTTTFTATATGNSTISLTGDVVTGNLIVNGDFENLAQASTVPSQLPYASNPTASDGTYSVANDALNNGSWSNTDWNLAGNGATAKGNAGYFMIVNGAAINTAKPLIWGQNVAVTPGKAYTLSFDFTSISYIVSDNMATAGYGATPTAPYRDVLLEVYVNGTLLGTASTNFAANGGLSAVGKWKNYSYPWTAGSSTTAATLEIRQITPANEPRGYDYGLDNISFGGFGTQTDNIVVGPVTDCSSISAAASICVNDSMTVLTATLSGGLIFDHWEKTSAPGVSVGTTNPITVKSLTATSYTAVGYLAAGNVLSNGNFDQGNTGFIPYYTYTSTYGGNQYNITANTSSGNGFWSNLPYAPGQAAGSTRFTSDNKGPKGTKIVGWSFTATTGQKFSFSGWAANQHTEFTKPVPDTINSGTPAYVGVYINNVMIAYVSTGANQNWYQMAATWIAPSTGTFTLDVRDLKGTNGAGNDVVLDGFVLAPAFGSPKTANVTTPLCNPCLNNIATIGTHTFCGNNAIVSLTPSAGDLAGVTYTWYKAATGGAAIGTTTGTQKDTFDITGVVADGAGNKTIYYTKSAKGSGTVFKKTQSCEPSFIGSEMFINSGAQSGDNNYQTQFTAAKAITITDLDMLLRSDIGTIGDNATATITFSIVGSKINNGFPVADPTVSYGTLSASYTRTRTAAQTQVMDVVVTATGNVNVPAGVFFIYPSATNKSGNGQLKLGRGGNCAQANTVDDLDGATVSRTGMSQGSANNQTGGNNTPGYAFNIDFKVPAAPCPRIPVVLNPLCPCTKPTTVTITAPAVTPKDLCQGTGQTLSGNVTVGAAALNGFTYSWFKTGTATALQTAAIAIPVSASTPVPNYAGITGLLADAGTYRLRVEDGNTGNTSCYTEASVVINVNPKPAISSASSGVVCSGMAQNYAITSAVTSTYAWTRAVVTGVSNAAGNGSATPIAETLTNTTNSPVVIRYIITPTSTTGSCPGAAFNYDVTVNPSPIITSGATGSVCSGSAQSYAITSSVTSTYAWNRAAVTGISNAATTGSAATITEALINTTTSPVIVRYVITPTATTGTCLGAPFNYDVTVNPKPVVNSATAGTVCSGIAQSYAITSAVASSYAWSRAAVTGISNAANTGSATSITETLTNTTNAAVVVRYVITPTSSVGTCLGAAFNYDVTVNPVPAISSGATGTICSGATQSYAITSAVASAYAWSRAAVTGISNAAATGSATSITEALTNTTAAAAAVRYIITPTSSTGTCLGAAFNYDVTVNPTIVPSVTISPNTTNICAGANVILTAGPTGGGTTPTYQWKKNGTAIGGATANTYSTTAAVNGDQYTVVMTTNALCPSTATATSAAVTITVSTVVTPTITIAPDKNPICAGGTVNFSSTPANEGSAPTYQWRKNGSAILGETNATYSSSTLVNGDKISLTLTSSSSCASSTTATSAQTTMSVTPNVTPALTIAADKNPACAGTKITFTPQTTTNGGTAPAYQWRVNGVNKATGAAFNTTSLLNGDVVDAVLTSNETCVSSATATSAGITVTITANVTPSVTISADVNPICASGSVTFTAVPNQGGTPTYQWRKNGTAIAGETNSTLTTTTAANTDVYDVIMTSTVTCVTSATATSNPVTMTVNPGINGGVISTSHTICYNTFPNTITTSTGPTGATAAATISWEASTDNGVTWNVLPGQTSASLTSPVKLTVTTQVRKIITDASLPSPCNVGRSNAVIINVNPDLTAGAISGDENICSGVQPAAITETGLAAGGTGAFTYTWEQSIDGGSNWTIISGAASNTYAPPILTATTMYRRNTTSGTCGTVTATAITKSVTANTVVSVGLADPGATCAGATMNFTATPTGEGTSPTYQWTVNGAAAGINSPSFSSNALVNGDKVQVSLTSSITCKTGSPASSPVITVNVVGIATPTVSIVSPGTICAGTTTTFTATSSGGGPTPTYQWYLNGNPAGLNQTTYGPLAFANNDQIRVEMKSSLSCASTTAFVPSNTVTMNVLNAPTPSITETNQQFCSGSSFTYHATTGGGALTWYKDGLLISGANNTSLVVSQSGAYTVKEDNGTCAGPSAAVNVLVIQTPSASAGADIFIKEGETGTLNGSGGAIYSWSPSTGLSNPAIANPTFVANNSITYILTVWDASSSCPASASVNVLVEKPIKIPNAITVNNDGNNDTWDIENIQGFPSATFEIYNRYGTLVWKSAGYPKQWDGTNFRNGEVLPDGTYFYIIDLHSKIYPEPYTGYIQVLK